MNAFWNIALSLFVLFTICDNTAVAASSFLCEDDGDCYPNGTCDLVSSLKCICDPGFVGDQCNAPCPLNCQNGSRCTRVNIHGGLDEDDYFCDCTDTNHVGVFCQTPKEEAITSPNGSSNTLNGNDSSSDNSKNAGLIVGVGLTATVVLLAIGLLVGWRRRGVKQSSSTPQTNHVDEEMDVPSHDNDDVTSLPSVR